jgi:hypothetical protein
VTKYILRYDGIERFAEGDAMPSKNRIMRLQRPTDDRRNRDDMSLIGEDMHKYTVTDTLTEIWEVSPGHFEGHTVIELERIHDGTE